MPRPQAWRVCPECDHLIDLPEHDSGQESLLICPVCRARLARHVIQRDQQVQATGLAALVALGMSLPFDFISFAANGLSHTTTLFGTLTELGRYGDLPLALFLFVTVVILPLLFIVLMLLFHLGGVRRWPVVWRQRLGRTLVHLKPWLMSEVFLIGVLVSSVKIMSIAELGFGLSFWAFVGFTLLLVRLLVLLDRDALWRRIRPEYTPPERPTNMEAARGCDWGLTSCHTCLAAAESSHCARCGSRVHHRHPESLQRVLALLVVSVCLYIPANTLPVMITDFFGDIGDSTIMGGVIILWEHGSYPIALIILIASVMVPTGKILALLWLCWRARQGRQEQGNRIYRVVEFIGRWSMIDVFVVSILVALIQQAPVMAFYPGTAALYFAGVVVMTMLASEQFDPRLLWDKPGSQEGTG